MRLVQVLVLGFCCLAGVATSAEGAGAAGPERVVHGSGGDSRTRRAMPLWRRVQAERLVTWKEEYGELALEVGKEALKQFVKNERCSNVIPAHYFCPDTDPLPPVKPASAYWAHGYALTWNNRSPGSWSSPSSPRSLLRTLVPGMEYYLTCYSVGDTVNDGGISTNLWYRLPRGGWVNDGWVETGTNSVIPGVRHC